MRDEHTKVRVSDESQELKPRSAAKRRLRPGPSRAVASTRFPGLRWVPAPLAVLAAAIGALVIGSLQGQVSAANANQAPRYEAGGISVTIGAMNWMDNSMTGQPVTKGASSKGYSMPSSEMPGMQAIGDDRLRVEVDLSNVSSDLQRYSMNDFSLVSPGGKTWHVVPQGNSNQPAAANLRPGFGTIIDMYFDMPAKYSKHLKLIWTSDGVTKTIPVNPGAAPMGGMQM